MRLDPARLARFVLLVALVYAGGVLAWDALSLPFRSAYASAGNLVVDNFGAGRSGRLKPMLEPSRVQDTLLDLSDDRTGKRKRTSVNVYYRTYLPLTLLVALCLATPMPWRRRLTTLGLAMLILCLIFAAQLWLVAWSEFLRGLEPGARGGQRLPSAFRRLLIVIYSSTTSAFVIPILLWGMILYLRGDARALLGRGTGERYSG